MLRLGMILSVFLYDAAPAACPELNSGLKKFILNFHVAPLMPCNTTWHEKYKRKLSVFSR